MIDLFQLLLCSLLIVSMLFSRQWLILFFFSLCQTRIFYVELWFVELLPILLSLKQCLENPVQELNFNPCNKTGKRVMRLKQMDYILTLGDRFNRISLHFHPNSWSQHYNTSWHSSVGGGHNSILELHKWSPGWRVNVWIREDLWVQPPRHQCEENTAHSSFNRQCWIYLADVAVGPPSQSNFKNPSPEGRVHFNHAAFWTLTDGILLRSMRLLIGHITSVF